MTGRGCNVLRILTSNFRSIIRTPLTLTHICPRCVSIENMRRNMSYRKPAPVYVPSPPTSPAMDPICPSFLMANETDQLYQVSIWQSLMVPPHLVLTLLAQQNRPGTKEKPLPTIPATRTVRGAPRAKPLASSKGINVEPPPITRQASKVNDNCL